MIPVAVLLIQFVCRLYDQTVIEAMASTVFLSVFVWIAIKFGGWSSHQEAWKWLKNHPRSMFLVIAGTVTAPAVMIYYGGFSVPAMVAETLGGYFVFHSILSLGVYAFEKAFRINTR